MREILFRGKDISTGEMVTGDVSFDPDLERAYIKRFIYFVDDGDRQRDFEEYVVDPETVGQYTGLTDKNGTKIFEGDLFKFDDEAWSSCETSCGTEYDSWDVENYAVVGFHENTGSPDFVKYKYGESSVEASLHENHDIEFYEFVSSLEIIGNIHDNPELLDV